MGAERTPVTVAAAPPVRVPPLAPDPVIQSFVYVAFVVNVDSTAVVVSNTATPGTGVEITTLSSNGSKDSPSITAVPSVVACKLPLNVNDGVATVSGSALIKNVTALALNPLVPVSKWYSVPPTGFELTPYKTESS